MFLFLNLLANSSCSMLGVLIFSFHPLFLKKKFLSKTQDEPIKTLSFFLFSLVEMLK